MVIHEMGHSLGAKLQGVDSKIEFWKDGLIPSLRCIPQGTINNKDLFYISGGLSAGSIYLSTLYAFHSILPEIVCISLFTIGMIQICYSIFETLGIEKMTRVEYRKRYLIYAFWIFIAIILYMIGG